MPAAVTVDRCDNSRTVMEDALREAFTSAMLRYFNRPEVVAHLIETASRAELATRCSCTKSPTRSAGGRERRLPTTRAKDRVTSSTSPPRGTAPASILEKIRELEVARRTDRFATVEDLGVAMLAPLDPTRGPRTSSRGFATSARFSTRAPRTREKRSNICSTMAFSSTPSKTGRYRARWTVRGGALFFGETTKPPVGTEGLEERSTLWVAGAGFEPTTFGL